MCLIPIIISMIIIGHYISFQDSDLLWGKIIKTNWYKNKIEDSRIKKFIIFEINCLFAVPWLIILSILALFFIIILEITDSIEERKRLKREKMLDY